MKSLLKRSTPYLAIFLAFVIYTSYWSYVTTNCPNPCFRGYDDSRHYRDFIGFLDGTWPGEQMFVQSPLPGLYLGITHFVLDYPINELAIPHLLQIFLMTLATAMAYQLGRRLFSHEIGLVTILFLSLYEFVKFYTTTIETASILAFLVTATLYFLDQYRTSPRKVFLIAAGLCLGISVIGRQNNIVVIGAFGLSAIMLKTPVKKLLADTLIVGITMLLVISPFIIRNSIIEGHLAPFIIDHGISQLTMGNLPGVPGHYTDVSSQTLEPTLRFITEQPLDWFLLTLRKTRLFFTFPWSPARFHELPLSFVLFWITTTILWIFYFIKSFSPQRSLLHLTIIFYAMSIIITHVEDEYRHPILPIILMFASVTLVNSANLIYKAVAHIYRRSRHWQIQKPAIVLIGAMLILLLFFINVPRLQVSDKVDSIESDPVYSGIIIGQRFQVNCPNLHQINVKMFAPTPDNKFTFHLKEQSVDGPEVYKQSLDTTHFDKFAYHSITFPAIENSAGKEYLFFFDTTSLQSEQEGLYFAGGRPPFAESLNRIDFEPRIKGGAFVSLGELDGNLAFSAHCQTGILDLFDIAIERFAQKIGSTSSIIRFLLSVILPASLLIVVLSVSFIIFKLTKR